MATAPKTDQFSEIEEQVIGKLSDTMAPDGAAEMVVELVRAVWNARGAADVALIEAERSSPEVEWLHVPVSRVVGVICALDQQS